jgi:hypothetical protein
LGVLAVIPCAGALVVAAIALKLRNLEPMQAILMWFGRVPMQSWTLMAMSFDQYPA